MPSVILHSVMSPAGITLKRLWVAEKGHPNIETWMGRYYSVEVIPPKGLGLVARADIQRGTLILEESPIYTMSKETIKKASSSLADYQALDLKIKQDISAQPKDIQEMFFSMINGKSCIAPELGRMRTNSLPMGTESGIFPIISRTNHSCYPNSHFSYNPDTGTGSLYSIKNTFQGEELTIAYRQDGPQYLRHRGLLKHYGFDCNCELCTLKDPDQIQSNRRQLQILQLLPSLSSTTLLKDHPAKAVADVFALLKHYETEDITDERINAALHRALEIHVAHGDLARAKIFAQRTQRELIVCHGLYHPLVQEMNTFVKNPVKAPMYGVSMDWRLGVREVPDWELGEGDFEGWLWERGRGRGGVDLRVVEPRHPDFLL